MYVQFTSCVYGVILSFFMVKTEAVTQRWSLKNVFFEILQNLQKNACARVSFLIKLQTGACNFITKETLTQLFSCEFYEVFRNTFFIEHLWWLFLYK